MEFFDDRSTRYALVKKGGSSTLGRALRPEAQGGFPLERFVVIIRHPMARLVSGWADLVRDRGAMAICKVDRTVWSDFHRFATAICKQTDEEMDHHFQSQVHGIQSVIDMTYTMQPCGQLFIGLLEELDEHLWPKLEVWKGPIKIRRRERWSTHDPWQNYFDPNKHKGLRISGIVEERFAADLALWNYVNDAGGWFEHQWGLDWQAVWAGVLAGETNFTPSIDKRSAMP